MFIFGSSGVGIATYEEHGEIDGFIKIELNIPASFANEAERLCRRC